MPNITKKPAPRARASKKEVAQKGNIRERVYLHLRERMQRGQIGHEDRLVDHEIALELSVSRMPVREALMQLKSEGFVESTSRGFVLRRFTPADIAHIFEVRLLLEPAAAAAACEAASIEGLAQMRMAADAAEKAHQDNDIVLYMKANSTFRSTWLSMVPNPHLTSMITRLSDHFETVRITTLRDIQYRSWSLESTIKVLDAFMKKDIEAVQEGVRYNLRRAATSYYAIQANANSPITTPQESTIA